MKTKVLIIIIILLISILAIVIYPILGRGSDTSKKTEYVDLTLGAPFITNVKDGKNLVKAGITIRLNNKKAARQLEENIEEVRDIVNFILRGKTEEEFRHHSIQQVLKGEIKADVNERFRFNCADDIFFTELVLQ